MIKELPAPHSIAALQLNKQPSKFQSCLNDLPYFLQILIFTCTILHPVSAAPINPDKVSTPHTQTVANLSSLIFSALLIRSPL
jgi:hypothetical protein